MLIGFLSPTGKASGFNLERVNTFQYNPRYKPTKIPGGPKETPLLGISLDSGEIVNIQGPIATQVLGLLTNGQIGELRDRALSFTLSIDDFVEIILIADL